jgi:hypothetical protein
VRFFFRGFRRTGNELNEGDLSVVSRRSASRMHSKYFLWETVPSNFHFSLFSFILVVTASIYLFSSNLCNCLNLTTMWFG